MPTPKWPGDHEEKHREAAKLGWRRRRYGGRVEAKSKDPRVEMAAQQARRDEIVTRLNKNHTRFQEAQRQYNANPQSQRAHKQYKRLKEEREAIYRDLAPVEDRIEELKKAPKPGELWYAG